MTGYAAMSSPALWPSGVAPELGAPAKSNNGSRRGDEEERQVDAELMEDKAGGAKVTAAGRMHRQPEHRHRLPTIASLRNARADIPRDCRRLGLGYVPDAQAVAR